MQSHVDKQLVDEAMDAYIAWREECVGVWDAFGRWASAPRSDAAAAFSGYCAALDREECASNVLADALERVVSGSASLGEAP
jgi:hypothetical protein